MTRINPVPEVEAKGRTGELYGAVKAKLGLVPNLMKTMAVSTPVLESYLAFSETMGRTLAAQERELISLAVAEVNACAYCASAHSVLGKMTGLSPEAILAARKGTGLSPRHAAIAELATAIAKQRGQIDDNALAEARDAGLNDGEIAEVVANVALNVFTNFFNNVAETEIDFPKADPIENAA